MDIQRLSQKKSKYFWSISSDDILICGGNNKGRIYGIIEIEITNEQANINKTSSDGVSSTMQLAPEEYSNSTKEYQELLKLKQEIKHYLEDDKITAYQDENRDSLMRNVSELLPKYPSLV